MSDKVHVSDKVIVIIGTAEPEKAQAGAMYALNAVKYGWLAEVKLLLFGPAERLVLEDEDLQDLVRQYLAQETASPIACKFLADRDGQAAPLEELGLDVQYVGPIISESIKAGFVPMVW